MEALYELGQFFPGSRIGVMLVHGLTGTPTELAAVAKDLNKRGFSVLCPLMAGHCGTEEELIKTNRHDWVDSVKNALDVFSKHMDLVFAGGISAGAVLSLKMAQLYPEKIRGLVLYSITLKWDGWSIPKLSFLLPLVLRLPYIGKRYRFMETFPYGIMNVKLRERISTLMTSGDAAAAGFPGTPGLSLRELWRLVAEVKACLRNVKIPTLLIHARNDDIASARNAMYVREHIGGPAKLVLLDNSYHMIAIDQERRRVSQETAAYFYELLSENEREELNKHATRANQHNED